MPSSLESLSYIVVKAENDKLEEWSDYGTRLLGLQLAEKTPTSLRFRMDNRAMRWLVSATEESNAIGFQVKDAAALNALEAKLKAAGVEATRMSDELSASRFVDAGIFYHDPCGNRHEASYGAKDASDSFVPGHPHGGFLTAPEFGMGHCVLHTTSNAIMQPFVEDVLGFSLTDYAFTPFNARFYHLNSRHHSLAMIETGRVSADWTLVGSCFLTSFGTERNPPRHVRAQRSRLCRTSVRRRNGDAGRDWSHFGPARKRLCHLFLR